MEIKIIPYNTARCYLDMSPKKHQKCWLSLTSEEVRLLKSKDTPTVLVQKLMLKKAYYDGLNHGKSIIPVHFETPLLSEVKTWWANLHGAYLATTKVGEYTTWMDELMNPRPNSQFDFELRV